MFPFGACLVGLDARFLKDLRQDTSENPTRQEKNAWDAHVHFSHSFEFIAAISTVFGINARDRVPFLRHTAPFPHSCRPGPSTLSIP
jgi:hypothetical protein